MKKILFGILIVLPLQVFSDDLRIYGYGNVDVRILDSTPEFQKCDGELLDTYYGMSEKDSLFQLIFLDYSEKLDSFLGNSSIVSLETQNNLGLPIKKINDNNYLYLIRLNIIHPGLLDIRNFTFRYFNSKCFQIVQAAPGFVDVNFSTFATLETSLEINRLESRGSWY